MKNIPEAILAVTTAFIVTFFILGILYFFINHQKELAMAKEYSHTVVVEPSGSMVFPFPIDMLRYDRLTPKREVDSGLISHILEHRTSKRGREREALQITLTRQAHKNWIPTYERWKSFSWTVVDHKRG